MIYENNASMIALRIDGQTDKQGELIIWCWQVFPTLGNNTKIPKIFAINRHFTSLFFILSTLNALLLSYTAPSNLSEGGKHFFSLPPSSQDVPALAFYDLLLIQPHCFNLLIMDIIVLSIYIYFYVPVYLFVY